MREIEVVSNALPQEYLELRQWAKLTLSCANEHAIRFEAADQLLADIVRACEALVVLCESVEREHFSRGQRG